MDNKCDSSADVVIRFFGKGRVSIKRGIEMNKLIYTALLLTLWAQPAHALVEYIDPGSGSAIMAAVIGFFVAVGITIKTYWYKLLSFFGGKKKNESGEE
jgi:hypothetical protein